jgi:hypothetical protein
MSRSKRKKGGVATAPRRNHRWRAGPRGDGVII